MAWTSIGNVKGATGATGTGATAATVGPLWTPSTYVSGNYYFAQCQSRANTGTPGNSAMAAAPWVVTASLSVTRLFMEFTVAGEANSYVRLGVYDSDANGQPHNLVLDAGTISTGTGNAGTVATGGTPGVYETTVSLTLAPGLYFTAFVAQNAPTTRPTITYTQWQGLGFLNIPISTALPGAGFVGQTWSATGTTPGALPALFPAYPALPSVGSTAPRVGFKVA